MATLKARAGSALKAQFRYQDAEGNLINTTGFTAHLQLRAVSPGSRIIMDTSEGSDNLTLLAPGHWRIFLGKSITNSLPPTVRWELELVDDSNPEDVTFLASGTIQTEPEVVTNRA
jgi:hypothetical protein